MNYNRTDRTLETDRLLLRLFKPADAEEVRDYCNNYNIYRSTLTLPYPYPLECAVSWMANHEQNFDLDRMYEFAITDKTFTEKNYHRVYARHFASNPASGKIMQKCGMSYEGTLKDHIYKNDSYEDLVYYGILNPVKENPAT